MPEIRFPGFGKVGGEAGAQIIRKVTGYNVKLKGDDLVIGEGDPSVTRDQPPIITIGSLRPVSRENYELIADDYLDSLAEEFEAHEESKPFKVPIYNRYGLCEQLRAEQVNFFFCERKALRQLIVERSLDYMRDQLGMRFEVPLRINANRQQGLISLSKICLLLDHFGPEEARRVNFESEALSGLLPSPAHFLSYVDALLMLAPIAIAIPLTRVGSGIYFFRDAPVEFPRPANAGIFEVISTNSDPLSADTLGVVLGPSIFGSVGQRRFFEVVVKAINGLLNYLNDLSHYQNEDGTVDHQSLIQAHCLVHLVFSELLKMNYTNSQYLKQKISLSILNKLANLRKFVGSCSDDETGLVKGMLRSEHGDLIAKTLRYHLRAVDDKLGRRLYQLTHDCYRSIRSHLTASTKSADETVHADYVVTVRNTMEHGVFLKRKQFERVHLTSDGSLPAELTYLPFLFVLALALEPRRIIEFC